MSITDMRPLAIVAIASLAGCSTEPGDGVHSTLAIPCSVDNVTGSVPGVTISIWSDSCVYRRGQSARFHYRVTVDASIPAITVPETGSCACNVRGTPIETWVGWSISGTSDAGNAQQYCLCDTGCCAGQDAATIQPETGVIETSIAWSGRTWHGPSDFGQPQGDYFELGSYNVHVGFAGYDHGSVSATLPFEIVAF